MRKICASLQNGVDVYIANMNDNASFEETIILRGADHLIKSKNGIMQYRFLCPHTKWFTTLLDSDHSKLSNILANPDGALFERLLLVVKPKRSLSLEDLKNFKPFKPLLSQVNITKDQTTTARSENNKESNYLATLKTIDLPNCEKIRRHYLKLSESSVADDMQNYFIQNIKKYKALLYDALEQFIERLDGQTIKLIDWGCGQGLGSMLILDYIREKQLKVIISQIILLDSNTNMIMRAESHVKTLCQSKVAVVVIEKEDFILNSLNTATSGNVLHLFVNDRYTIIDEINNIKLLGENYFLCLSSQNNITIESIFNKISTKYAIDQIISNRNIKVGKFQKFEKIFKLIK